MLPKYPRTVVQKEVGELRRHREVVRVLSRMSHKTAYK